MYKTSKDSYIVYNMVHYYMISIYNTGLDILTNVEVSSTHESRAIKHVDFQFTLQWVIHLQWV